MTNIIRSIHTYRVVRWVLAGLFIWAGSLKLADPEAFAIIISDFGILPDILIPPTAYALPVLEIVAGLGLIFDLRGSLATITILLIIFIIILGYAKWLGLDIDCGCFGPDEPEHRAYNSLNTSLIRDLFMLVGVVFLYGCRYLYRRSEK